jgi:nitroreductase
MRAPSARNTHSSELIVVSDPQMLSQLSIAKPGGAAFIKDANLAIVVVGDPGKAGPYIENDAITAVFIQLAAQALGLGSRWAHMRGFEHSPGKSSTAYISDLLGVPDNLEAECIIAIGYPDEEIAPYKKQELPTHIIHRDKY